MLWIEKRFLGTYLSNRPIFLHVAEGNQLFYANKQY